MAVTIAACPAATVPPWYAVYSPVAAHASRYVRSVVPEVRVVARSAGAGESSPNSQAQGWAFFRSRR